MKADMTNARTRLVTNIKDQNSLFQWIKILRKLMDDVKIQFEYFVAVFLLAFTNTGSVSSNVMEKRLYFYKNQEFRLIDVSSELFSYLYNKIIQERIEDHEIDPENLISYFSVLLEDCTNMKVKPLAAQASFRKMTPLLAIAKSMSEFSDFPWEPMLKRSPVLMSEFWKLSQDCRGYQG
ncbi:hypothetical protein O0L34_g8388 [Tuta absoluta]|nr:hypothetical protein O0L34_g8388 [Tuta absoluta]